MEQKNAKWVRQINSVQVTVGGGVKRVKGCGVGLMLQNAWLEKREQ